MNRLAKMIDEMSFDELRLIKRDLESGNIDRLINKKIEMSASSSRLCPVCHNTVDDGGLTLIFGPKEFKQKASFCAFDCLEYFLSKLKKQKEEGGSDDDTCRS